MALGDLILMIGMLLVFVGVMIFVGFYCRKHSTDVNGFVLGGRSVGDSRPPDPDHDAAPFQRHDAGLL